MKSLEYRYGGTLVTVWIYRSTGFVVSLLKTFPLTRYKLISFDGEMPSS